MQAYGTISYFLIDRIESTLQHLSGVIIAYKQIIMQQMPIPPIQSNQANLTETAPPWQDPLMQLLESTGEGIYGIDTNGSCTFINRAGARMLGYTQEQVHKRNMHYLIHHAKSTGHHYPETECPIYQAFRQGAPCRIDKEVFWRADGSGFFVEYSSYPIIESGEIKGAVVTFIDISERKRKEELLEETQKRLELLIAERTLDLSEALNRVRNLSAHLHSIREEERTRIAREIHDELGSLLIALKFDVTWLGNRLKTEPNLALKCDSMAQLMDNAVVNVGRIITDLRPSILDHQGLWAALEWQAQEFIQTTGLSCEWHMQVEEIAAPEGIIATAIFRIFQEILSNIARHAHATHMNIHIDIEHELTATGQRQANLVMHISDDGCGTPMQTFEQPTAYGVIGMRERVQHFGGTIILQSAPQQGTQIKIWLPLDVLPTDNDRYHDKN